MIEQLTAGTPYTIDTGEKLVNQTFGPNNTRRRKTGTHQLMPMTVRNGRLYAGEISLERNGFVLVEPKTTVSDLIDTQQLESAYYPEVEQLIRRESGASRVVIFDHTPRSGDDTEREAKLIREPVMSAHNDYTEWSGPNRVREFLSDEAKELLTRRVAIIQAWARSIDRSRPIPLALADARSVAMADRVVAERRYPHRVGQTYRSKYNPNHRWNYFPEMRRDEALVFRVYDSER